MSYRQQEILIETNENYGRRPPMDFCGAVFRGFAPMLGYSVRMALEGSSSSVGAPPSWLRKAADVRVTGFAERAGATILNLEAPLLGEAAQEIYSQNTLWETKPAPNETAVNVLARVLGDVRDANDESAFYDRPLLGRVARLRHLLAGVVTSIRLPAAADDQRLSAVVNEQVVESAVRLWDRTPPSAQIRLTGVLDMIRHSTRSFGLVLEGGAEVRGVLETQEQMKDLTPFLGAKVLVLGRAVYRPSGKLLRVDAHSFDSGEGQPQLFGKVPPPREKRPPIIRMKPSDQYRKGVGAFFGIWPGEESDEDFTRMLKEIRG
ncbi:MAG TPA: hypothetical protein VKM93_10270 [Terriglobia bacterium]|nr:hypothetical protein [Terriglobia bacterium]